MTFTRADWMEIFVLAAVLFIIGVILYKRYTRGRNGDK